MNTLSNIYSSSLSLLTDLYQLTMAYGYWKNGIHERESVFHLFFRKNPFKGGYAIAAGVEYVVNFINSFKFDESDIDYLKSLKGNDGKALFESEFLKYLSNLKITCTIESVKEGEIVFPNEPLIKVTGALIQAQLLETALLNIVNFQTLIATKSSRICSATGGETVLEFGLRRAQGVDGGISASRAAYIGGAHATSNVLAGKLFGIPIKGTHAHSWVMSFDSEIEAFEKYADAMPNNSLFLVDTYDTIEGVKNAVKVGKKLREKGHEMLGIRLDSGDLAYLSIKAREILDEGGFPKASIVASNDLNEETILSLKAQGGVIDVWGVGTQLATAYDQPALGGVYKLAAIKNHNGSWDYKVKLSEQAIKTSNPGSLGVKRFELNGEYIGDMIYNSFESVENFEIIDPFDDTRRKNFSNQLINKELLITLFKNGEQIYQLPHINEVREYAQKELSKFHLGIKRFLNPHQYPVGLETSLFNLKKELIFKARAFK
ncbi:nicotinate phosphoribosyltransferase [bacterium]|nr:nicotinate phosphoribosyltransferase [bacterium]